MNIQNAIKIAYEHNKWIKRKGEHCKIKPTNNDYECCLIVPSENYPKTRKTPSRYWNPIKASESLVNLISANIITSNPRQLYK